MTTVETWAEVEADQTLKIGLPKPVEPGRHRVVLVLEETTFDHKPGCPPAGPLRLNKLRLPAWPADSTFRRDDLYGDAGR
jgi:hypothetical protein